MERIKKIIKQSVVLEEINDKIFNIVPNEETNYSFKILLTNRPHNIGLMDSFSKNYINIYLIIEGEEENEEYGFYGDIEIYNEEDEKVKTIYVSEYGGLSDHLNVGHFIDDEVVDVNLLNKNILSPDLSNEWEYYLNTENLIPIRKTLGGWRPAQILERKWSFDLEEYHSGHETDSRGFTDGNVITVFMIFELQPPAP